MRLSVLLLSVLVFFPVFASSAVTEQGTFSQEKHFKGFNKPFISTGSFELAEDGLTWQVESPVKSTLLIKQGQVYTLNAKGEPQLQKGAEPYVNLLQAILKHDEVALAEQFTMAEHAEPGCQTLLPKDDLLKQLFSQFELCVAAEQVSRVRLQEVNGNFTVLRFAYPHKEHKQ